MSLPRLLTDEDVYAAIAPAMRKAGIDAVSTPECNRRGESDEAQLAWAAREGRALVTFNVAHFAHLHATWLSSGRHHAGIIVSAQRPIGEIVRRLTHLAFGLESRQLHDRLEFLSDW